MVQSVQFTVFIGTAENKLISVAERETVIKERSVPGIIDLDINNCVQFKIRNTDRFLLISVGLGLFASGKKKTETDQQRDR